MSALGVDEGRDGLALPLEGWPDVMRVEAPDRSVMVAILAAGLAVDAALRSGVVGVGGALAFLVGAGGLLATRRVRTGPSIAIVAIGGLLGSGLALRTAEWILALDVLAAGGLLAVGATYARGGDPFDLTVPRLFGRWVYVTAHTVLAPAFPLRLVGPATRKLPAGIIRGFLLAAPVVLVVGALLASADAVFASFLQVPDDAGDLALHAFLLVVGAWGASALLRTASAEPFAMPSGAGKPKLGATETSTVLAALAGVLAVFAASQAVAFARGAEYVEQTSGLSYAEYARSGFFQLIAVGLVSVATLWALRASIIDRAQVLLTIAVTAGNLVIVGVAIRRLFLYESAYGLTVLRLVAVAAAVWLGAVLVLTALAVARPVERQWLLPAAATLALAMLFLANVVNVEASLVDRNVDRFAGTGTLDVDYLAGLSDDAVPAIVARLDQLTPEERSVVLGSVCGDLGGRRSWLEANVARSRADRSRVTACRAPSHR